LPEEFKTMTAEDIQRRWVIVVSNPTTINLQQDELIKVITF
jgi:hypothetical protein